MAVLATSVLYGKGVLRSAYHWRWELLSQLAIITTLVLAYPVKLSIVDTSSVARKIWQRFRVPASFDPATVLYPPLLPVLVALSVSSTTSCTILINIIVGLSSLPQRLFPRSSRLGGLNVLHWLVAILPLLVSSDPIVSSHASIGRPSAMAAGRPSGLSAEVLSLLYPLHQALLQPLQYLTTTSLLTSELHLLSAALINLLLLAKSPQAVMLKACLWMGGLPLFVMCSHILHWNVALMRVPNWKFRRQGRTAEERKSLIDAVTDLINLQRATSRDSATADDSDADEDEPEELVASKCNGRPKLTMNTSARLAPSLHEHEPASAIETSVYTNGVPDNGRRSLMRPRRNTLPVRQRQQEPQRQASGRRPKHKLAWYLYLTPAQAAHKKYQYSACVFLAIVVVVLVPVRLYVQWNALSDFEPVGWALGYLLGQLEPIRSSVRLMGLDGWIPLPFEASTWQDVRLSFPLDVPTIFHTVGSANVRLLLIIYWAAVLLAGLLAVFSLTAFVEVDTRRKVFHGVMVAMMLPSVFVDPCACALALVLILAVFLLLEVVRAGQVPPLGNAIGRFVAPYVDGRDLRGPVVVSHIFLLIGCAVPLWFSLASISRTGNPPWSGWELEDDRREVAMLAGVICVGMGDAAASLVGRRYGRHKWPWVGGKSLEGSAAFAAAVTVGLLICKAWLILGGWTDNCGSMLSHLGTSGIASFCLAWAGSLAKAVFCACGASFMEAVLTGANDNVVVPIALWLFVKGLRV